MIFLKLSLRSSIIVVTRSMNNNRRHESSPGKKLFLGKNNYHWSKTVAVKHDFDTKIVTVKK